MINSNLEKLVSYGTNKNHIQALLQGLSLNILSKHLSLGLLFIAIQFLKNKVDN